MPIEVESHQVTLAGVAMVVSIIGGVTTLYRFFVRPRLDRLHAEKRLNDLRVDDLEKRVDNLQRDFSFDARIKALEDKNQ